MPREEDAIAYRNPGAAARAVPDVGEAGRLEAAARHLRVAAEDGALLALRQLGDGPTRESDLVYAYGPEILGSLARLESAGLAHVAGTEELRTWALTGAGRALWTGLRLVVR